VTAAEVLGRALLEIADQGRATPCQGRRRDRWTSDHAEERAWAATVCVGLGCEVLGECRASAAENGEKHHVWGGVDRTTPASERRTRRRRATAARTGEPEQPQMRLRASQPGRCGPFGRFVHFCRF